jgi:SAM-dependent methyltransferase
MDKNYIIKKIKELIPWYQAIDFDGVLTQTYSKPNESAKSGEVLWNKIKTFLPETLEGKRVLDLGCNAGYYCIKSLLLNCKEVIGIERDLHYYNQALFVKEFYEEKLNKKLDNIKYIRNDISDINFNELGKFDYVFAISILYHIGKHKFGKYTPEAMNEQRKIIGILTKISPKIIVRCRNKEVNGVKHYDKIFKEFGYENLKYLPEGKRGLILYGKKMEN